MRSPSLRDASTYVGSFISTSACRGVFVRGRRTVHTSRSGASSVTSDGGGAVRFQNVYIVRRYRSLPWLCSYTWAVKFLLSSRNINSSQTPAGWYGETLLPP